MKAALTLAFAAIPAVASAHTGHGSLAHEAIALALVLVVAVALVWRAS